MAAAGATTSPVAEISTSGCAAIRRGDAARATERAAGPSEDCAAAQHDQSGGGEQQRAHAEGAIRPTAPGRWATQVAPSPSSRCRRPISRHSGPSEPKRHRRPRPAGRRASTARRSRASPAGWPARHRAPTVEMIGRTRAWSQNPPPANQHAGSLLPVRPTARCGRRARYRRRRPSRECALIGGDQRKRRRDESGSSDAPPLPGPAA